MLLLITVKVNPHSIINSQISKVIYKMSSIELEVKAFSGMAYLLETLFLFWLFAGAEALCSNATVCVANGNEREAECPNSHPIIHMISDLTASQKSCRVVQIHLTRGIHILDRDLHFSDSVRMTTIHGAPHANPSIIECLNYTGIRFSENNVNMVHITNVVFVRCQKEILLGEPPIRYVFEAALYFRHALYTLNGVTVREINGYGLHAEDCREQIISNCTFINNGINFRLRIVDYFASTVLVLIKNSRIHDGIKPSEVLIVQERMVFIITDCDFKGGNGLKVSNINSDIVYLNVTHSNFSYHQLPDYTLMVYVFQK